MSLNDLNKKIYKRDGAENGVDLNFYQKTITLKEEDSGGIRISEVGENMERNDILKRRRFAKIRNKILLWSGIVSAALILLGTAALFYFLKNRADFREKDILFELEYPEEVLNGDEHKIIIKYGNFSRVGLRNAALSFQRSNEIKIISDSGAATVKEWNIGNLDPGKSNKIEIPARIFGKEGSGCFMEAAFQYTPENFNSAFKISRSGKINIVSVPIKISILAPKDSSAGKKAEYNIVCENISGKDYSDLKLRIEHSGGFVFESAKIAGEFDLSEIDVLEDGSILAGDLASKEKIEYLITGNLTGEAGRGEIIKAKIGFEEEGIFYSYDEEETSITIRESEVLITQMEAGGIENVDAGDIINFKILVKNTSETGLAGVEVKSKLEGSAIDFASVKVENGFINSNNEAIWNSSGISELAYFLPSREIELNISLKIKERLPISSAGAKNFSLSSFPSVKASNLPEEITGNPVIIKVNSKIVLVEKAFYWEEGSLKNSGPIPPRVGQTTNYTIHWQILNLANDVNNAKVSAVLPAGNGWSGGAAANGTIKFDNITRTVVWDIGNIPANSGVKLPVYEAVFQISIVPSQADVGKTLTLLGEASAFGIDNFTGVELASLVPAKTSELREDEKLEYKDYKVVY